MNWEVLKEYQRRYNEYWVKINILLKEHFDEEQKMQE